MLMIMKTKFVYLFFFKAIIYIHYSIIKHKLISLWTESVWALIDDTLWRRRKTHACKEVIVLE